MFKLKENIVSRFLPTLKMGLPRVIYVKEQNPAEFVQNNEKGPMEIRYAGKVYKVHGVRAFPGGRNGYIIEDEPGHYDCILNPDEVLGGYGIKNNGSPYPTKDIAFSGQSAEWNWEDEENFKWFDKFFRAESIVLNGRDIPQDKYLWFKSLRPHPKQKWSEEDKGALEDAICATDILGNDESFNKGNPNLAKAFRIAKDWLKTLPERFNLQPKQEWSEEDEMRVKHLIGFVEKYGLSYYASIDKVISWLKSLHPQSHWKPSEEQMYALTRATNRCVGVEDAKKLLKLLEQLKSL